MKQNIESLHEPLWQTVCNQIRPELQAQEFAQWFGPILPVSLHKNVLTLQLKNAFTASWFEQNYGPILMEHLHALTAKKIKLVYTLAPEEAETEEMEERPSTVCGTSPIAEPRAISTIVKPIKPVLRVPEGCDHNYTFDNFVVGDENQMAYACACKAVEDPGFYNPLFIYGDTSLGKTHLLHAIAIEYATRHPEANVKYVTLESMLNDFTQAVLEKKHMDFRNRYRDVDMLLVDDIQFLGNKEQMQTEFFNTFNAIYGEHKQIVMASDRRPSEINGLTDRLVSRFESGLITEVLKPCFETRFAVLKKYRELYNIKASDEVLFFIAERITDNIRQLRGAMVRLEACESLHRRSTTIEDVEKLLGSIIVADQRMRPLELSEIQRKVAEHYHIKMVDLLGERRTKNLAMPRQVAMYLCRELTSFSFPDIGAAFRKNHGTVIHACKQIKEGMQKDPDLRIVITALSRNLKG